MLVEINVPTHLLAKDSLISDMRFMHFIAVVIAYPDYEENLLSSLRQGKNKKGNGKGCSASFFFFPLLPNNRIIRPKVQQSPSMADYKD